MLHCIYNLDIQIVCTFFSPVQFHVIFLMYVWCWFCLCVSTSFLTIGSFSNCKIVSVTYFTHTHTHIRAKRVWYFFFLSLLENVTHHQYHNIERSEKKKDVSKFEWKSITALVQCRYSFWQRQKRKDKVEHFSRWWVSFLSWHIFSSSIFLFSLPNHETILIFWCESQVMIHTRINDT